MEEGGGLRKSKFAKYMVRLKQHHAAPLLILGLEESGPSLLYLPGSHRNTLGIPPGSLTIPVTSH